MKPVKEYRFSVGTSRITVTAYDNQTVTLYSRNDGSPSVTLWFGVNEAKTLSDFLKDAAKAAK